jgi:hypothetical protein
VIGRKRAIWLLFGLSLAVNIVFAAREFSAWFNGPEDRVGVLTSNVGVGAFGGSSPLFVLPQGATVRDASPRGFAAAGTFEPHRLTIIVTTENETLVNYAVPKNALRRDGEFYSADIQTTSEPAP